MTSFKVFIQMTKVHRPNYCHYVIATPLNDQPHAISLPQMSHSLLGDTQDRCGHSIEKTIHSKLTFPLWIH